MAAARTATALRPHADGGAARPSAARPGTICPSPEQQLTTQADGAWPQEAPSHQGRAPEQDVGGSASSRHMMHRAPVSRTGCVWTLPAVTGRVPSYSVNILIGPELQYAL